MPFTFQYRCDALALERETLVEAHGFRAELTHRDNEPANALRVKITAGDMSVELLPSKGLSLAGASFDNLPIFWDPPAGLPDPDLLDLLSDEIMIGGKPARGFTYLKTFMAGIEFYGLRNWGMPRIDTGTGELHPLHGETSNIPVRDIAGLIHPDCIQLRADFLYRQFTYGSGQRWHESGRPMYEVTRIVTVSRDGRSVELTDRIANITNDNLTPDWGYHVTFRPEDGSRLLVPSASVEERAGGTLPADFETWHPARDEKKRSETGIVHKRLKSYEDDGYRVNRILMTYPSGRGISLSFRPSPYFQTWFCSGGRNSTEFEYTETGKPVLEKNWDGQGIEIGSSALDHNGNVDDSVGYKAVLEPGEVHENRIRLEVLTEQQANALFDDIQDFNRSSRRPAAF